MQLRRLEAKDNQQLADLIRKSLEEADLAIPGTAYFDPELTTLYSYYDQAKAAYWVISDQGTIIGGIGIAPLAGVLRTCELQKLYVSSAYQKQGLAQKLMETALSFASQQYEVCYLETHHSLEAACRLYERFGFQALSAPLLDTEHQAMDRWYQKKFYAN
ncbi:GNAT family N-acetyltransferase [uncultured Enterococcus sp.]|uniref:GNAT family N-acetyltransferase n=1 Tax=uncultured Enterococcus sp. TaxID=167972 RepID=UPI0025DB466C|nr:GNAT family N-acetyltransferase [uncultured Enterococcus sp.]